MRTPVASKNAFAIAAPMLVVGGSPGAATRFFLGDRVGAILQAAPAPAVIVRSG